jgi:hypothetical protein
MEEMLGTMEQTMIKNVKSHSDSLHVRVQDTKFISNKIEALKRHAETFVAEVHSNGNLTQVRAAVPQQQRQWQGRSRSVCCGWRAGIQERWGAGGRRALGCRAAHTSCWRATGRVVLGLRPWPSSSPGLVGVSWGPGRLGTPACAAQEAVN